MTDTTEKHRIVRAGRIVFDPAEQGKAIGSESPQGNSVIPSNREMIGQEVKFWRNEKNLTGAKLAKLAGMSAGMLTKVEKGDVSPSINTLVAIANALNVPISMFFYRLEKSRYVSYVPAGKGLAMDKRGSRAGHTYEMLGHNVGHMIGIEPFIVKLDKKSKPYSMFQEEGFKFVYMMTGEIVYRHGDRLFPLKPGDALTFDAMAPHGPEELIKLPVTFLSIAAYSRFDPGMR